MRNKIFSALVAACVFCAAPAFAQDAAYQGYSGADASAGQKMPSLSDSLNAPPSVASPQAPAAPQVQSPTSPQAPAVAAKTPPAVATATAIATAPAASQPPPDLCAAYKSSYQAYAACQDRVQKIQRMKDAKKGRDADAKTYSDFLNPPATPPAAPSPVAITPATPNPAPAVPQQ